MGLIPEITCRRCGFKYSGLKSRCPQCGAPRANQATRTARTTAAGTAGTASYARAEVNGRWQLIFAGILAAAVILATVVLVFSDGGSATSPGQTNVGQSGSNAVTVSDTYLPSPSPSPEPTPDNTAPAITSMELIFLESVVHDITVSNPGELELQFSVRVFPQADVTVQWSSSNENILTVDDTGLVKVVGADPNRVINATIKAECEGLEATCIIYVPYFQAAYLTDNAYTAQNAATPTPDGNAQG